MIPIRFRVSPFPLRYRLFSTTAINNIQAKEKQVPPLCSPSWLASELAKPDSRIITIDSSWHMPGSSRDAKKEFGDNSIENSRFFDIDVASDTTKPSPHMLPTTNFFSEYMSSLNITNNDHVVVYDSVGIFSSCRVFWTFKVFGHQKVSLLNGGLPRWVKEGFPTTTSDQASPSSSNYHVPQLDNSLVKSYSEIRNIVSNKDFKPHIFDARPSARFTGKSPEPRPEISSGHMPKSISLPFPQVLDQTDGDHSYTKFKSPSELQRIFEDRGVNQGDSVIFSCGSGVTACILDFALKYGTLVLENQIPPQPEDKTPYSTSVYDGSWSEYAMQKDAIIVKDP